MENAREKLMDALRDLVLQRGYAATSVDAICEQAGVSKGSFFHHFQSKEEAAAATLDRWVLAMQELAAASGFQQRADPPQRLRAYLDFLAGILESPTAPTGCLLGTLALELSSTHPEVRVQAARHFKGWSQQVAALVRAALGDADDARAIPLANHLIASLEGALLLAKVQQEPDIVRATVQQFRQYVELLL